MKKNHLLLSILIICISSTGKVQSQAWDLIGNAGTDPSANFIGTTDNTVLKFRTKNAVRMTVNTSGNVGIGIASPAARLHLFSNSTTATPQLLLYENEATDYARIKFQNSSGAGSWQIAGLNSAANSSERLNFWNSTSGDIMSITGDGKVGIGTTAPEAKLNITGSNPVLQIGHASNPAFQWQFNIGNNGNLSIIPKGSGVPTMHLHSTGQVGIGTIFMMAKLDVRETTPDGIAIFGENNYAGNSHGTGVWGMAVNNPGYGVGVIGSGGLHGVHGLGDGTNFSGTTRGVFGQAVGTTGTRYGVHGDAYGGTLNVGVFGVAHTGTTNYGVYCQGSGGYTGTWTNLSDRKFKNDITPVTAALSLVNRLNPVTYQLKAEEYPMMNFPAFRQYGFVAQELETVIPLLVENGMHAGAEGEDKPIEFKSVNYIGMVPVLTKAIQELNENFKSEISRLKSENEMIISVLTDEQKQKLNDLKENKWVMEPGTGEILYQNSPNPFSEKTIIAYNIPSSAQSAVLKIYASEGNELKSIPVTTKGYGQAEISGESFSSGIYNCILLIDGKRADAKQLTVVK